MVQYWEFTKTNDYRAFPKQTFNFGNLPGKIADFENFQ